MMENETTKISSLQGKTISKITMGLDGTIVFIDENGVEFLTTSYGRIFDGEGYNFDYSRVIT